MEAKKVVDYGSDEFNLLGWVRVWMEDLEKCLAPEDCLQEARDSFWCREALELCEKGKKIFFTPKVRVFVQEVGQ